MLKASLIIVLLSLTLGAASTVEAQVTVVRAGNENPVLAIGKSTLYGAATGTLLGLALSLVIEDDFADIMRWSFVGGTLGGFAIGVYHVANRPQPTASLLQFNSRGLARVNIPQPQLSLTRDPYFDEKISKDLKVNLASLSL